MRVLLTEVSLSSTVSHCFLHSIACVLIHSFQDFDAVYPETGVSFGPTICSFGLPYNDHNYALPVGLTPPAMAPHLMDINYSTRKTPSVITLPVEITKLSESESNSSSVTVPEASGSTQDSSQVKSLIKNTKGVKLPNAAVAIAAAASCTSPPSKIVIPPTKVTPLAFASIADATAGLSDSKKTLFAAWHAKAAATGGTLLVQQRWKAREDEDPQSTSQQSQQVDTLVQGDSSKDQVHISVPRYCRNISKEPEGEKVYLESDMKVSHLAMSNSIRKFHFFLFLSFKNRTSRNAARQCYIQRLVAHTLLNNSSTLFIAC